MYQLLRVNSAQVRHALFLKSEFSHRGLKESRRERARDRRSWTVKRSKCQDSEITWPAVIYTRLRFGSRVWGSAEGARGSNSDQSPVKVTVSSSAVCQLSCVSVSYTWQFHAVFSTSCLWWDKLCQSDKGCIWVVVSSSSSSTLFVGHQASARMHTSTHLDMLLLEQSYLHTVWQSM